MTLGKSNDLSVRLVYFHKMLPSRNLGRALDVGVDLRSPVHEEFTEKGPLDTLRRPQRGQENENQPLAPRVRFLVSTVERYQPSVGRESIRTCFG